MSKDSTLKKVEYDVSQGDFGKARDRLHSLIGTYPDDLSLRSELARIYAKLQYPIMAGRYWYLEESKRLCKDSVVAISMSGGCFSITSLAN